MKNIFAILVVILCFVSTNAQEINTQVNKEVVLEKVDKNSDLAYIYCNGVLVEKGLLVNGKREGVWQSFNSNGTLTAEASFSKGLKNGVWIVYANAELKYVLHYQNDSRVRANDLAAVQ